MAVPIETLDEFRYPIIKDWGSSRSGSRQDQGFEGAIYLRLSRIRFVETWTELRLLLRLGGFFFGPRMDLR